MKDMMDTFAVLAGVPVTEGYSETSISILLEEDGGSDSVIKALRDTDYKDSSAHFKMVQLLKGLASASEKDEKAKKFMDAVSDALTSAAKKILGEDVIGEADKKGGKDPMSSLEAEMDKYRKYSPDPEGVYKLLVTDLAMKVIQFSEKLAGKKYDSLSGGEFKSLIGKLTDGKPELQPFGHAIDSIKKKRIEVDVEKAIAKALGR